MKKKISVFFVISILSVGLLSSSVFADLQSNMIQNNNSLVAEIRGITLTVSPNGVMSRVMYGNNDTMDYNKQYGTNFTFLKLFNWNGSFAALVYDNNTGEKKVIKSGLGFLWQEAEYDFFAESDIDYVYGTKFKINDAEVYGDQLYIACDNGIIIVMTPCVKCYKLKKVSDVDIKSISFQGTFMKLNANTESAFDIPIENIRQNNISVEEAINMRSNGAIFIDVRDESEFNEYHYSDSINIPLSRINQLSQYDKNTVLIFYCKSGGRAASALKEAQKMGFINVYNLGSVDELM